MTKRVLFSTLVLGFALSFVAANVFGAEPMPMGSENYEVSQLLWVDVQNRQGDHLGKIADFVIDSDGRVAMAVILGPPADHRLVAVPFSALSLGPSARYWIMDITREKLAAAPSFRKEDLSKGKLAEDVYRYFGLEPSWTDEPHEKGVPTYNDPYDLVG